MCVHAEGRRQSCRALAGYSVERQLSGACWKGQKVQLNLSQADREGAVGNVTTCMGNSEQIRCFSRVWHVSAVCHQPWYVALQLGRREVTSATSLFSVAGRAHFCVSSSLFQLEKKNTSLCALKSPSAVEVCTVRFSRVYIAPFKAASNPQYHKILLSLFYC